VASWSGTFAKVPVRQEAVLVSPSSATSPYIILVIAKWSNDHSLVPDFASQKIGTFYSSIQDNTEMESDRIQHSLYSISHLSNKTPGKRIMSLLYTRRYVFSNLFLETKTLTIVRVFVLFLIFILTSSYLLFF